MRALFTTAPLAGHLLPLVPTAWALRAAGHDVLVTTRENFVPVALRSGLPSSSCGPAVDFTGTVADGPLAPSRDEAGQRGVLGGALARVARGSLAGVRRLADVWRPDLIVSERAEFAGPLVAAALGIPWVRYHWSVSCLEEYRRAAEEEFAPELTALGLDRFPDPARVLDPWPVSLRRPDAVAHDGIRHVPAHGDAPVPEWAFTRGRRPRICVTLGTMLPRYGAFGVRDFLAELVEETRGSDCELLIAVDDDIVARWPPLPAAVRHAGRLPLAEVLPACDVVVHHGGQGTSLTALAAGRPQVVMPRLDDQFDNAQALAAADAALLVPPSLATPAAVAAGCAELLENALYAKAAAGLAETMALLPSPSAAVGPLEHLGPAPGMLRSHANEDAV
ncbi:glycosyltransferase [Streptomyces spiramyceticus]|uniref:Glycosyltransferase n=1 Tax=Streptomyces spiramyceticus TaxID=299717 RepID=A0A411PXF7_9ACTN|nr:glycosyltransferase [Streptomyces spiramyceticus]QBG49785.1 glycosyltransferase [Streptomyces spiramyceticus]